MLYLRERTLTHIRLSYVDDATGDRTVEFNPYDERMLIEVWNGKKWAIGHTLICGGRPCSGDLVQVRLPERYTFSPQKLKNQK